VWEADIELKLMGAVRLTRMALPALRESRGAVVNTLATSGKAPDALSTPTSVSRAAGLALTKALSRELAPEGIRVNAVLIGVIESGQLERRAAAAGITPQAYYERMVTDARIPLGRGCASCGGVCGHGIAPAISARVLCHRGGRQSRRWTVPRCLKSNWMNVGHEGEVRNTSPHLLDMGLG